ncbi:hypothetical protein QMM87_06020 [Leptospira santarosai]|uniref:hypothetical protein n=1 Tax=Leptospira santarosai TaxID=28183 RepID=UPI0024AEF9CD|nr:hypothetical protein [Leptospira santarosai]MDI7228234.1 hypothetical protein [Leptospira santarosai]
MLSVLMLTLNCGPICGLGTNTSSAPCHQESNSEKSPGCEWDSGSIALTDSHLFKSLKSSFIPSHVYSTDTFFSLRPAALRIESALLGTDSDRAHTRSSVRLLI